jgi:predicted outer membrane repeat protein
MWKFGLMRNAVLWSLLVVFWVQVSFAEKIAFEKNEGLPEIRAKIEHNGYSFQVKDYGDAFKASRLPTGRHTTAALQRRSSFPVKTLSIKRGMPESFDLRSIDGKSYIQGPQDQGNLGSCYSFAACAAAESVYNRAFGLTGEACVDLSESYVAWSLGSLSGYGDHFYGGYGADYEYAELWALTENGFGIGKEGICLETDYPYTISQPSDAEIEASWNNARVTLDNWFRIYPDDYSDTTMQIKAAIYTYGAVDAAVYVTNAFAAYSEGVFEDTFTESSTTPYYYEDTNHAISLVGWDDNPPEGGGGCWILRNSWGTDWGEDGYMRIRYHSAAVNCAACCLELEKDPVTFTVEAPTAGSGTTLPVAGTYAKSADEFISLSATPTEGYLFGRWTATPADAAMFTDATSATTTLVLDADATIQAEFGEAIQLTLTSDETITTSPELDIAVDVAAGFPVAISAPCGLVGKTFDHWEITSGSAEFADDSSCETEVTPTVTSEIKAVYRAVEHLLTENFVDAELPDGWSSVSVSGSAAWSIASASPASIEGSGHIALSADDEASALLVSPAIDLSDYSSATVSFASYVSAGNSLTVKYRLSTEGEWIDLAGDTLTDTTEDSWTWNYLDIESESDTFQLAFAGELVSGTVCLDAVMVTDIIHTAQVDFAFDPGAAASTSTLLENSLEIPLGTTLNVSVSPDEGFVFDQWTGDPADSAEFADSAASTTTATIADDVEITAVFNGLPKLIVYPESLDITCIEGETVSSEIIELINIGEGDLEFTVSDDASWLQTLPKSGTLSADSGRFLEKSVYVPASTLDSQIVERYVDENGREVVVIKVDGRPPEGWDSSSRKQATTSDDAVILGDVPAFNWTYGCSATTAGMLFGYYDRLYFPDIYTGSVNLGVCPLDNSSWGAAIAPGSQGECPFIASHLGIEDRTTKGHVDDFWEDYVCEGDPYYENWDPHCQVAEGDCLGDFMGTSQWYPGNIENTDGSTKFYYYPNGEIADVDQFGAGSYGLQLFSKSKGLPNASAYTQTIVGYNGNETGFSFTNYKNEINAGRPVLIHVVGHTMLGVGYEPDGTIYIHNTWDYGTHTMTWGGSYEGMQHYSVSVFRPDYQTDQNYQISGTINKFLLDEMTVVGENETGECFEGVINADGTYTIADLPAGEYLVYVSCDSLSFEPEEQTVVLTHADAQHIDFTAQSNDDLSILFNTLLLSPGDYSAVISISGDGMETKEIPVSLSVIDKVEFAPTISGNGAIYPAADTEFIAGEDQTLYFVPDDGWRVANVTVNGDELGEIYSFDWSDLDAEDTIEVEFVEETRIYHVDASAAADGDGLSWATAFNSLDTALQQAGANTEVWIKEGTYVPETCYYGTDPEHRAFRIPLGTRLYGGFPSDAPEEDFASRTPWTCPTILSGEISEDVNAYHVVCNADYPDDFPLLRTLIDGVTVTSGAAAVQEDAGPSAYGGGIYSDYRYLEVANCLFQGNQALTRGGAIYSGVSTESTSVYILKIFNCIFKDNESDYGGGVYSRFSKTAIVNSVFIGNTSENGPSARVFGSSQVRIVNCVSEGETSNFLCTYSNDALATYSVIEGGFSDDDAAYGVVNATAALDDEYTPVDFAAALENGVVTYSDDLGTDDLSDDVLCCSLDGGLTYITEEGLYSPVGELRNLNPTQTTYPTGGLPDCGLFEADFRAVSATPSAGSEEASYDMAKITITFNDSLTLLDSAELILSKKNDSEFIALETLDLTDPEVATVTNHTLTIKTAALQTALEKNAVYQLHSDAAILQNSDGVSWQLSEGIYCFSTFANALPTAADATLETNEDTPLVFGTDDFSFDDTDADAFVSIEITALPETGWLLLNDTVATLPLVVTATEIAAGKLKYWPPADENGEALAEIEFSVSDGYVSSAESHTITIDVLAIDDAPVTVLDTALCSEDASVLVDVLTNDYDPDSPNAPLILQTAVLLDAKGHVSIQNNRIFFETNGDFESLAQYGNTMVRVTYEVADLAGNCATGQLDITIYGSNDLPAVSSASIVRDTDSLRAEASGWTDPDGDAEDYTYQWYLNGDPVESANEAEFDMSACCANTDTIRCELTPTDGTDEGTPVTSKEVIIMSFEPGWNLRTLPFTPADSAPEDIFCDSETGQASYIGSLWGWNQDTGAYCALDSVTAGSAFWMYCPEAVDRLVVEGTEANVVATNVTAGNWTLLGGIGEQALGNLKDADSALIESPNMYMWQNGAYLKPDHDLLHKTMGVWVYFPEAQKVVPMLDRSSAH